MSLVVYDGVSVCVQVCFYAVSYEFQFGDVAAFYVESVFSVSVVVYGFYYDVWTRHSLFSLLAFTAVYFTFETIFIIRVQAKRYY